MGGRNTVKKTIDRERLLDILSDDDLVTVSIGHWRHGTVKKYVCGIDGQYYQFLVRYHYEEGPQIFGPTELEPVKLVEKTELVWVPVEEGEPQG